MSIPVGQNPPQQFRIAEVVSILAAAIIAHAYYIAWQDVPILHDAAGYLRLARQILADGLFSKFEMSDLRTYLHPWLLGWLIRLSESINAPIRLAVFEWQLGLHILASLFLRQSLLRSGLPVAFARLAFAAVILNPLVLIYTGYLLTESFSMSLEIILFGFAIRLQSDFSVRAAAGLTFVSGLMIMTRPANVYFLPAVGLALTLAIWKHRPRPKIAGGVLAAAAISFSLPFLPQLSNNIRHYGKATPLLVSNLGTQQQMLSVLYIKYATVHIPDQSPQMFYFNPYYEQEQLLPTPLKWYIEHPGKAAMTVALHIFDVLDQDLPFPFNTNVLPWYYPLVSILNLIMVATGLIGVVLAPFSIRRYGFRAVSLYAIAVTALAGHFALHSMVMIEARFGVPALLLLYVFAVWVATAVLPALRVRRRILLLIGIAAAALAGSQLSAWVRNQAPMIRTALERQDPKLQAAAREIAGNVGARQGEISSNLANWVPVDAGVTREGEAVLVSKGPGLVSLIHHTVPLEKSTDYIVEFDARAVLPPDASLSVDLYAAGYDSAEQNSVFLFHGKDYRHFTARWNSGKLAPAEAALRFVTLSTGPFQVRNIMFRKANP